MRLITVKNLCKNFGGQTVLKDLSFNVELGDILYIVGENGSGKTTLIKILLSLEGASSGSVEFNLPYGGRIGYLPQRTDIQSDFPATVKEVVMSGFLNSRGILPFYKKEQYLKADKMMKMLEIYEMRQKSFKTLSGGQKQRVLLCRALCAAGGVILLDEPLTGLDPLAAAEFYSLMEKLNNGGMTIIMISHDVSCAVKHGNKILHLGRDGWFFGTSAQYANSRQGKKMLSEGHSHD